MMDVRIIGLGYKREAVCPQLALMLTAARAEVRGFSRPGPSKPFAKRPNHHHEPSAIKGGAASAAAGKSLPRRSYARAASPSESAHFSDNVIAKQVIFVYY